MYSLMNIVEAPRIANYLSPAPLFAVHYISFDGTCLTASNNMSVECSFPPERLDRNDMLFVVGRYDSQVPQKSKLLFSSIVILDVR